tara:strand:+ start:734 stop:1219 length:486 start_codon:yes stop_codon:yes gene_type:complete
MKTLKKKISKGMTKKKFYNKMNKWKRTVKKYSHDVNKLGYRSDCSGLVSYLWGLPKKIYNGGPRTRGKGKKNLMYWSREIKKRDLRRGDALIVGYPAYHVVVFDRWANREKTEYYVYEMCNKICCRDFKYHKVDYPYTRCKRPRFKTPTIIRRDARKINKE